MNRCFFIGHRDVPEGILEQLTAVVRRLAAEEDVKEFVIGRCGRFDHLAARAAAAVRREHREIRLVLLTPYHPAERPLNVPEEFDEVLYPFEKSVPPRFAIVEANRKAICRSSHLVAYVCHPGKTRDFLAYAERRNVRITRIMP